MLFPQSITNLNAELWSLLCKGYSDLDVSRKRIFSSSNVITQSYTKIGNRSSRGASDSTILAITRNKRGIMTGRWHKSDTLIYDCAKLTRILRTADCGSDTMQFSSAILTIVCVAMRARLVAK